MGVGAGRTRGASVREAPEVPGPAPLVRGGRVLGPVIELHRDRLAFYERAHRECGDVARLSVGLPRFQRDCHFVMHPDGVRHVLTSGAYGKDSPGYRELRAYLGSGLLTSQCTDWERQKRLLQPLFTPQRVTGYAGVMAEEAELLVTSWRDAATAGRSVDLHAGSIAYTLRVVGRLLFGTALDDVIDVVDRSVDSLQRQLMLRVLSPVRLPRRLPTRDGFRTERRRCDLYAAVDALVARACDGGASGQQGGDDLLTLLLGARDPVDGSALSPGEVRNQVLVFMLAGHETTANALTYTLHLLGRHPEVQERVRAEAVAAPADGAGLAYTTQVVGEAMRLYPPVCHIGRSAKVDDVVMGRPVRAGDVVMLPTWVVHRDPRWWPDPLRFDPDRFRHDAAASRPRYAYLPFGGGPRTCIGARFALLEAGVAVAAVTRAFAVTVDSRLPRLFPGITLRPQGPVPARLDPHTAV